MLINSVIIVLREVLEAALMLSVLLAASRALRLRFGWAAVAIVLGGVGALLYGLSLPAVSDWLDGAGQEVTNASMQLATFAALGGCVFLLQRFWGQSSQNLVGLRFLMASAIAIAVAREGAEIFIYVSGFWGAEDFLASVGAGSVIGAAIGCSVGALLYYVLLAQPKRRLLTIALVLLILIGCGMCAQAVRLLIQVDYLSAAGPLWDTSFLVPEQSLVGQLLYAMVGYEASPSAIEVSIYTASFATMTVIAAAGYWRRRHDRVVAA